MDTKFDCSIIIELQPHYWRTIPKITYGIDSLTVDTISVTNQTNLTFNHALTQGPHIIWIEFNNKNYDDCILEKNLDMAIEISAITIEGMTLDRFRWSGLYYPIYPSDYPDKQSVIKEATYLGWNGRWELPFTTPIFTWIHRLENLGWLYEP
jgi:hypothetical protein